MITDLLNKLKLDKEKIILIGLVAIIILYLDFTFLLKSQFRYIKNISPKIVKAKIYLNSLVKDLAMMQSLQDKQPSDVEKEHALETLKTKKIITEEQIPSLLQYISDTANKNNINIIQIRPLKEYRGISREVSASGLKFSPVLITLNLSCGYHNFGKFVNDLENTEIFIAVEEIKIVGNPNDYLRHNVNLSLRTYVRK